MIEVKHFLLYHRRNLIALRLLLLIIAIVGMVDIVQSWRQLVQNKFKDNISIVNCKLNVINGVRPLKIEMFFNGTEN